MATNKRFVTKNGLDNNSNSITNIGVSGASLTQAGAFGITLTTTGTTNVTFPTSGTLATVGGSTATATNLSAGVAGNVVYQSGAGVTAYLATGTSSQVLVSGTTPAWTNTPTLTGTNFTGIPNAGLTNSSVTVGSTAIALGATSTTLAGLTSVAATTFTGALSGNATTSTTATNIAGGTTGNVHYQTGAGATGFVTNAAGVLQAASSGATPTWTTTPTLTGTNFTGIPNAGLTNSSTTINGTAIALGASGTVTAAAGTLTGATLNATVTASSLTSVGTLSSLTVSGAFVGQATTGNIAGGTTTYTGRACALTVGYPGSGTGFGIVLKPATSSANTNALDFLTSTSTAGSATSLASIQHLASDAGMNLVGSWTLGGSVIATAAAGTALNATNTTITDDVATATSVYPTWVTTTTGNLPQKVSSTKLSFVPSTGVLTSTTFSGAHTGSGAGLTSIPNGALTNSSVTIGSTNIALGATSTTLAGLSSVTSTTFVGAVTGAASSNVLKAGDTMTGLLTLAKGSSFGLVIGDVSTNNGSVLAMQGTNTGFNWLMSNNIITSALSFTPSTIGGGTSYTTPTLSLSPGAVTVTGTMTATSFNSTSTKRVKKAIKNLGKTYLDKFNELKPREYDRKDYRAHEFGFIAEEMALVYPEIVGRDSKNKPSGIDYGKLSAILTAKVQSQQSIIEQLQTQMSTVMEMLKGLK